MWEAWDGTAWVSCDLDSDGTGGLNRPGDVVIHLPHNHTASVLAGSRAGWLRCRVVEPDTGLPPYSASPTVRSASAFIMGGSVPAIHAETMADEVIGMSEGVPGESFELGRHPVVPGGEDFVIEIASGSGWDSWTEVDSFAGCEPDDMVFVLDRTAGTVHFPPAVREPDGTLRYYGAVPSAGSLVRVPHYRTGGGPKGNVATRAISVLRSTIPFVNSVENRRAAHGGVAPETIEQAKVRGPLALRTRDRAITAEDYEQLAKRAAPDIARVRCIPATAADDAGGVRVLVVPAAVRDKEQRIAFEDLVPDDQTLAEVASYLDARRPVGPGYWWNRPSTAVLPWLPGSRHVPGSRVRSCNGMPCRRSTSISIRSAAVLTVTDGPLAVPFTPAKSTRCFRGWPEPRLWTRCWCSPRIQSRAGGENHCSGSMWNGTRWCFPSTTVFVLWKGPDMRGMVNGLASAGTAGAPAAAVLQEDDFLGSS